MPLLAFLSMDNLHGFVSDDELAVEPLKKYGWTVKTVSWRQPCDWSRFDMVIIRSTWDYQNHNGEFLQALEKIAASGAQLQNDLELVKWNFRKTYLRELQEKGNRIVPTLWENEGIYAERLHYYFEELQTEEIIIKPVISANADDTFRLKKEEVASRSGVLNQIFSKRPFMVQPFMGKIIEEGEYSLFYFGGEYSHAILKTPKKNDFRVQEEHGGVITPVIANDELRVSGTFTLGSIQQTPLYARVDFVRDAENKFAVMEVELIEPALYFRMDHPYAAKRFAYAVSNWAGSKMNKKVNEMVEGEE